MLPFPTLAFAKVELKCFSFSIEGRSPFIGGSSAPTPTDQPEQSQQHPQGPPVPPKDYIRRPVLFSFSSSGPPTRTSSFIVLRQHPRAARFLASPSATTTITTTVDLHLSFSRSLSLFIARRQWRPPNHMLRTSLCCIPRQPYRKANDQTPQTQNQHQHSCSCLRRTSCGGMQRPYLMGSRSRSTAPSRGGTS